MHPTHRTPDGRLWQLITVKGQQLAELWGAVGLKRTRIKADGARKMTRKEIIEAWEEARAKLAKDPNNYELNAITSALTAAVRSLESTPERKE